MRPSRNGRRRNIHSINPSKLLAPGIQPIRGVDQVVVARTRRYRTPMAAKPVGVPMRGEATRLQLHSKVGELAGILEYEEVLAAVARLSIPELADWCTV